MPVYLKSRLFEKDIIFIHIPRTGGKHVQSVLTKYFRPKLLRIYHRIQRCTFGHYTWDNIYKIWKENGCSTERSDYFSFNSVRNPFDRILSSYLNYTIRNTPSFDDCIKMVELVVLEEKYIGRAEISGNDLSHYIPQTKMIGEKGADFIGRFENSENDINTLYDVTGIDIVNNIHLVKSVSERRNYYSRKSRQVIESIYREDLDKFGYGY